MAGVSDDRLLRMRIILICESLLSYSPLALVSTIPLAHHSTSNGFAYRIASRFEVSYGHFAPAHGAPAHRGGTIL